VKRGVKLPSFTIKGCKMVQETLGRKGAQEPSLQEEVIYRTREQLQLLEQEIINNTVPRLSKGVACAPFRKFGLYVYVRFRGTHDTINLHIEVEFLSRWTGQWYTYKQGLFAALYYEDTDTAAGIYECFTGDVLGRFFRVKLTGVGVSSVNYYEVNIDVDFWN